MKVHQVSYNFKLTKLQVTAACSVHAGVMRESEAKFNPKCDSVSEKVILMLMIFAVILSLSLTLKLFPSAVQMKFH